MKLAFLTLGDEYMKELALQIESMSFGDIKVDVYYNPAGPSDTPPPSNHYPISTFLPKTEEERAQKTYDVVVACDHPSLFIQLPISCNRIYLWLRGDVAHPGYGNVFLDNNASCFLYNLCKNTLSGIFCKDANTFMVLTEMRYPFLKNKRNNEGNIFVEPLIVNNSTNNAVTFIKRICGDAIGSSTHHPSVTYNRTTIPGSGLRTPTFIVNLDHRTDRFNKISHLLQQQCQNVISARRFSARNPKDRETTQEEKSLFRYTSEYERIKRNPYPCAALTKPGEIGCALSHYYIWKSIVADESHPNSSDVFGCDAYLVLEDDAIPVNNFEYKYSTLISYLWKDRKWEVFFLGSIDDIPSQTQRDGVIERLEKGFDVMMWNPALKRTHGGGTYAYLIRRSGAVKLLECVHKYGLSQAIDWFMLSMSREMMMYKTSPHLFISTGEDSDIQRT